MSLAREKLTPGPSIAEEAKDPARIVPKAISMALTFTYVAGWLFNIVLVFCMVSDLPRAGLIPSPVANRNPPML